MTNETKLLAEAIRNAPSGAKWFISSDSYDGIKYILGQLLIVTDGEWIVDITEENRNTVAGLIERHGLAMKIAHTSIESKEQNVLLRGYDRMVYIGIANDFYNTLNKAEVPASLDIELE